MSISDTSTFSRRSFPGRDLDDFLGGMGRAFRVLEHYDVEDAYAPDAPLVMNLGVFSGTPLMTGLRVFFSAYSPLKVANNGKPFAMWATASGKFATKVLAATVDEVIFLGRADASSVAVDTPYQRRWSVPLARRCAEHHRHDHP